MTENAIYSHVQRVISGAREFTIGTVLFHHVVGEIIGVNVTDMECLALIIFRGVATPSELSRHTGLSSGATTAMLDRLERSGLVVRRANPEDRRGVLIELTNEGARRTEELFGPLRAAAGRLLARYSASELALLSDFFDRMAVVWKDERERLARRIGVKE